MLFPRPRTSLLPPRIRAVGVHPLLERERELWCIQDLAERPITKIGDFPSIKLELSPRWRRPVGLVLFGNFVLAENGAIPFKVP